MLQEAIQHIEKLAQDAAGAENKVAVIELPGEPGHFYGLVKVDGEGFSFEKIEAEPPSRHHSLGSVNEIDAFLAFAKLKLQVDPVVWIGSERVVIVLDEGDLDAPRRETATLVLAHTPQFVAVSQLERTETQLKSKEMYRLIRRVLWETLDPDTADRLAKLFRSLAWTKTAQGAEDRGPGRANYGHSVAAQVTLGGEAVNLESVQNLTLHVQVYTDPMLNQKRNVKAILEDDPENQTFAIVPLPGELDRAKQEQLAEITTLIRGLCESNDIPCFYGTP